MNVGVLSLALVWIVGVHFAHIPVNEVMSGFPSQLLLTLAGVTLLFRSASFSSKSTSAWAHFYSG